MERIKAIEVGRTVRGNAKHLTNQEIASTVGVSERQVRDDLNDNNKTGRTADFVESHEDIIDAEIVPALREIVLITTSRYLVIREG
ncbi:hypothetical protein [Glutamicibacter arilaitensis]|uniref:hypothetical protein n=1 Tax=Glutamicibacter arilaitensis TaxID=256701 RepID=UPI003FD6812A